MVEERTISLDQRIKRFWLALTCFDARLCCSMEVTMPISPSYHCSLNLVRLLWTSWERSRWSLLGSEASRFSNSAKDLIDPGFPALDPRSYSQSLQRVLTYSWAIAAVRLARPSSFRCTSWPEWLWAIQWQLEFSFSFASEQEIWPFCFWR